jgi:hypothetical protein
MLRERLSYQYNRAMQRRANRLFSGVLRTPPIRVRSSADTTIYCAVGEDGCRQFILAAKSFLRYCPDVAVAVQSDGSLTDACTDEILEHIPGAVVYSKADMMQTIHAGATSRVQALMPGFDRYEAHTPSRIVYLKFLNVVYRFAGRKVILIDSDILFLRRPDFIIDWALGPYTADFYGEGSNAKAGDFHAAGFEFTSLDVANFSSGTIGVGGTVSNEVLEDAFGRIRAYDPGLLDGWEIEQALWAIVLARRPGAVNIDALRPVYVGSGWRRYSELREHAVIAHFAGAFRYKHLRYLRLAREVERELRDATPESR